MRSHEEIRAMSDEELENFLNDAPYGHMDRNFALEELTRRRLRPQWTRFWTFVMAVLATIIGTIAAVPVVREWFQSAPSAGKAANSPQPQSQSMPSEQQAPKTSASSDHPSDTPESKSNTKAR
jgi:hypothetical protein